MVTSGLSFFVPGFRAHFKDHKQVHFPGRVWLPGLIALTQRWSWRLHTWLLFFCFFCWCIALLRVIVLRMWLRICCGPDGGLNMFGHWRTNIHANTHKSQIEFLGHPAEVRGAVSPTLACRVSGLFPSVAKLRHPQQTPHHDLQNLLHLLLVVILSPLTSLSAIV
jgi:hypothetical protein